MISAVVLAAGLSERMGKFKPLLPYGKRTVIEEITFKILGIGLDEVVVITGHEGDLVADALAGYPVRIVHNFGYTGGGMLSSIKTGIRAVSLGGSGDKNDAGTGRSDCEAALLCLGDQPSLKLRTIERLVEEYGSHEKGKILVPSYKKQGGHPILIPASFWSPILDLPPDGNLRDMVRDSATPVHYVETDDDSILKNMNTPDEYDEEIRNLGTGTDGGG